MVIPLAAFEWRGELFCAIMSVNAVDVSRAVSGRALVGCKRQALFYVHKRCKVVQKWCTQSQDSLFHSWGKWELTCKLLCTEWDSLVLRLPRWERKSRRSQVQILSTRPVKPQVRSLTLWPVFVLVRFWCTQSAFNPAPGIRNGSGNHVQIAVNIDFRGFDARPSCIPLKVER